MTAKEQGLDLIEIAPNAKPPVCKITDFGKYKYELQKKASKRGYSNGRDHPVARHACCATPATPANSTGNPWAQGRLLSGRADRELWVRPARQEPPSKHGQTHGVRHQ